MSTAAIAYDLAAKQGWSDTTLLDLCLTYIARQQDDDGFAGYLTGIAAEENSGSAEDGDFTAAFDCGRCGEPVDANGKDGAGETTCALPGNPSHLNEANASEVRARDLLDSDEIRNPDTDVWQKIVKARTGDTVLLTVEGEDEDVVLDGDEVVAMFRTPLG